MKQKYRTNRSSGPGNAAAFRVKVLSLSKRTSSSPIRLIRYTAKQVIKLYTPEDDVQLAMLKGIFESEGIHFFVHNDNFGSMRPGIRIPLFNNKTIMVHEQDLDRAQEILKNFLGNIKAAESTDELRSSNYSFSDKCRMVIEALLFGWVMPGKRWQRKKKPHNQSPENDA